MHQKLQYKQLSIHPSAFGRVVPCYEESINHKCRLLIMASPARSSSLSADQSVTNPPAPVSLTSAGSAPLPLDVILNTIKAAVETQVSSALASLPMLQGHGE